MNQAAKELLLKQAPSLFAHAGGITALSEESLLSQLGISAAEFQDAFQNKDEFVTQAIRLDLDRQKREHQELFARLQSPVERMLALLHHGIEEMQKSPLTDYAVVQLEHPRVWEMLMQHLANYSAPQIHSLLNEGILRQQFRGDINIELVTKIIMEQMNLILNANVFPPSRYNLAEVFRSIYLYYIRGICTEEGIRLAATHFSRL